MSVGYNMLPGNVRMNLVKRAKSNLDNNYSCNLLSQQTAMRKNNFKSFTLGKHCKEFKKNNGAI